MLSVQQNKNKKLTQAEHGAMLELTIPPWPHAMPSLYYDASLVSVVGLEISVFGLALSVEVTNMEYSMGSRNVFSRE